MGQPLLEFAERNWRSAVEILLLAVVIYHGYLYLRGTRGARVLTGLALLFIGLIFISQLLRLEVIGWIVKGLTAFLAIALLVIFQPELRRALAAIGSNPFFSSFTGRTEALDLIVEAVFDLSNRQLGALIAIERDIHVRQFAESGVAIDGELSSELIVTIFHPKTPLHDGGLIIREDRILAAGCIFPVSQREDLDRNLGLRHRAGLGMTEESDAIAIIVSEETGIVSICQAGRIERNFEPQQLRQRLAELLTTENLDEKPPATQLARETGFTGSRSDRVVSDQKERRDKQSLPTGEA